MSKASAETTAENKKRFIEEFPKYGTITRTAEAIGVTRKCINDWCREDKEFASLFGITKQEDIEKKLEFQESQLEQWASNPEMKVGMVNFLAKMAWLKAHAPDKWNEKSFKKIDKSEHKKISITVNMPKGMNAGEIVEGEVVKGLLTEGENSDEG